MGSDVIDVRLIRFLGLVCAALLFFSTCSPSIPALWGLSQKGLLSAKGFRSTSRNGVL
jgi:hypothetical protein